MNLIDFAVLIALGLFILSGIYKSFLPTIMSAAANIVSWASGMIFMPIVSHLITGNKSLFNMLLYYTEGSEFIGDVELAKQSIKSFSPAELNEIVTESSLPIPFAKKILTNIEHEAFADSGAITLGDYYNQTIVCVVVNIIAFLLIFFVLRLILGFIIEGLDYSVRLPVLSQLDTPISAGFGLVNGVLILLVVFMVLPILLIVLNFEFVHNMVESSFFTPLLDSSNLLLRLISGTC